MPDTTTPEETILSAPIEDSTTAPIAAPSETAPDGAAPTEETAPVAEPEIPVIPPIPLAEQNWYVVKVRPGYEDRIKGLLEEQIRILGLQDSLRQVLIPSDQVKEVRNRKEKISTLKTYPGYMFVEVAPNAEGKFPHEVFLTIMGITGISGFVGADPKIPEKLPLPDIEKIIKRMEAQKEKPKAKIEFVVDQRVRIKDGAFANYEGIVAEVYPDKGLLKINVHVFGRNTPVELEFFQVEKI
jgi:transcriptional antiterminator NusG